MSAIPRGSTVGIIGAGRVGSVLGAALSDAGYPVITTSSSRPDGLLAGAQRGTPTEVTEVADLVIIAVPDDVLAPLVAQLRFRPGQTVAHTSGAHGTAVLAPAVAQGARPLAMHPAMTFTGRPQDLFRLRKGIPFGLTAPDDVRPLAEALVRELDGTPEWIAEDRRTLYHAALAHGANHLVTLVNEALDRLRDAGVGHPERVLDPLLHAALDNTLRLGDAALTGPVARGDAGTVAAHLDTLAQTAPESVPAYLALARRTAARAVAAGRITPAEAEPLLDVLGGVEVRGGMDVRGGLAALDGLDVLGGLAALGGADAPGGTE
jgi:predicted short-subunit dehydrogenase-like oxidoreductase (DUF2520 family)